MKSNPSELVTGFFEMQEELDNIFDSLIQPSKNITSETTLWRPPMDIYETIDSFVIKIEAAGLKPEEDIQIRLDRNILTISGNRQDRTALKKQHYHQAELNYGPFERSIELPDVLSDDVKPQARYRGGFLEINIPKVKREQAQEIALHVEEETDREQERKEPNHGG